MSLVNTGNTCYLGTALQCLMSVSRFVSEYTHSLDKNDPFVQSFVYVCKQLEHGFDHIQPNDLYTQIRSNYDFFNNREEHDAHEAIQVILDILSNRTKHVNRNFIEESFRIELKSIIKCGDCRHVITSYQREYGMFENTLCAQKRMNDYRCDCCGAMGACRMHVRIYRLPPCLILKSSKCTSTILKMHNHTYYLRAVCKYFERTGSGGGHYVAIVRKNDSKWYLKDDTKSVLLFEEGVDNLDPLFVDACFFVFETR